MNENMNENMNEKMNDDKEKKGKSRLIVILLIVCAVLAAAIVVIAVKVSLDNAQKEKKKAETISASTGNGDSKEDGRETVPQETPTPTPTPTLTPAPTPEPKQAVVIPPEMIQSVYGYMVRESDGAVTLDKNSTDLIYPASMTKMMTVLIAAENLTDLDETIPMTSEIIDPLYLAEASLAGFCPGETPTVRDLMYGAMLPSGGEACVALAVRIAGSEEAFAEVMNQRAAQMGLTGTHFTNASGLHDPNHFSTCRDMALLLQSALQNELFYNIITAFEYRCAPNEYHEDGLYMQSTMFKYMESNVCGNGAVIMGEKTGTTNEAGYCLASFAIYDGERYIMATAMGPFNEEGIHVNITDAVTAYGMLSH